MEPLPGNEPARRRAVAWIATAVWLAAAGLGGSAAGSPTPQAAPEGPEAGGRAAAEAALEEGRQLGELPSAESRRQALERLNQALVLAAALEDAFRARVRAQLGELHLALGEPRPAFEHYRRALELRGEGGDPAGRARDLKGIGLALKRLGRSAEALDHYRRAEEIARGVGNPELLSGILTNLGTLHYSRGGLNEALGYYRQALELRRAAGDAAGVSWALANVGVVYAELGRSAEALRYFEQGLERARELENVDLEVTMLNNLGAVLRSRGEIRRALGAFVEGLALAEAIGDRSGEAFVASNLGDLYHRLHETDRALELHRRALRLYRGMEARGREASVLMDLGWLHASEGDPAAALGFFEQALPMSRAAEHRSTEADILRGLGTVHLALGEARKALGFLGRALELQQASAARLAQAGTLRDLGAAHRRLGQLDAAGERLEASLETLRPFASPERESATRFELARLHRDRGEVSAARLEIEAALESLESLRGAVPGPELRSSLRSGSQERFDFYVDLLMELDERQGAGGFAAAAFRASERSRARGLVELLTEASFDLRPDLDPVLAAAVRATADRISWLQRQMIRALSAAEPDRQRAAELRRELAAVDARRQRLEEEVRIKDPRYARIRYPAPAGLETVRRLLDDDTAFLEYSLGDRQAFLFVVTGDDFAARRLGPSDEILDLVRELRGALERPGRRQRGRRVTLARQGFERLIAPAADLLEGKQRLLIAPDRDLYYLPFEVLRTDSGAGGAAGEEGYLIARWAVAYTPSATVLESLRSDTGESRSTARRPKAFVAFADPVLPGAEGDSGAGAGGDVRRGLGEQAVRRWRPLPGARREVSTVAGLFPPGAVAVYLGAEASEVNVKGNPLVATAGRLHFASHALLDEQRPAYSGLLLSAGEAGPEDGLLQAHEIFNLRLEADLVVLSACETGLGKRVRGEGLVGLTRAFMYAGARGLVVSLWPVYDRSTGELMVDFYRHLEAGLDAAAALRQAKLGLIREGTFAHPYHWASFILVGDAAAGR